MILLRQTLRLFIYYLLPVALAVFGINYYMTAPGREFSHWAVELGDFAWLLFWIVLFISPLSVLLPGSVACFFKRMMTLRRELGVLITWLVFYHTLFLIMAETDINRMYAEMIAISNTWFWGVLAGIATLIMGITSNNYSVRLLRAMWKRVHLLAYMVLITGVLHVMLADEGEFEFEGLVTLFPVYILLKVLAVVKQRRAANSALAG